MKVKSMKGFTLAELLIVMAIIVVLAAIAIPTFGKQLETAREAADAEAIRAAATDAFSQAYTKYVTGMWASAEYTGDTPTGHTESAGITLTQQTADFNYMQPSIKIGSGEVKLTKAADTVIKSTTGQKVFFIFKTETDGEGGIKLDDIKIGAAEASATSVKST